MGKRVYWASRFGSRVSQKLERCFAAWFWFVAALALGSCSAPGEQELGTSRHELPAANWGTSLSVSIPRGTRFEDYAVVASQRLDLRNFVTLGGNAAVLGNTATSVETDGRLRSLYSRSALTLRDRTTASGDVASESTVTVPRRENVAGAILQRQEFDPLTVVTRQLTLPAANNTIVAIRSGQTRTLTPGRYKSVDVDTGGELRLSSGAYYFDAFDVVDVNARINLNVTRGPVELYLKGDLIFRGVLTSNGTPGDFFVGVFGTQVTFERTFAGVVVAPNAALVLGTVVERRHHGAFFAKSVEVQANTEIVHDLGDWADGGCLPCPQPSNTCAAAFCDAGKCVNYAADGYSCEDGDPATTDEVCLYGACVAPQNESVPEQTCDGKTVPSETLRESDDFGANRRDYERKVKKHEGLVQKELQQFNLAAYAFSQPFVIPVVFHVLKGPSDPEVTDSQLNDAIAYLNQIFGHAATDLGQPEYSDRVSSTRIQFALAARSPTCGAATPINRYTVTVENYDSNTCQYADPANGGVAGWPTDKYLNVWVADLGGFIAGYGQVPPQVPAGYSGNVSPCKLGDGIGIDPHYLDDPAFVHEVGHWLSLIHLDHPNDGFGPRANGTCTSGAADQCATRGDMCCDTPPVLRLVNSCPATASGEYLDSCTGDGQNDMLENFMPSTSADCRKFFTYDQVTRMEAALTYVPENLDRGPGRGLLWASDGAIPPVASGELWMRDGPEDLGAEPSPTLYPWASDDIWIRLQPDGKQFQVHQNPVYATAPDKKVYVYARIRNRGCTATAASNVTLRWAKQSTSLGWPSPWDGSTDAPCAGTQPMGGTIGTAQVPALDPGEATIVEISWTLPNPMDYECIGGDATHFCLLSHIGNASTTPADLVTFVQSNNDVAWKNLSVAYDDSLQSKMLVTGANSSNPSAMLFGDLIPPGAAGSVFDWATIQVDLGTGLLQRWQAGGSHGAGIISVNGSVLTIDRDAYLTDVMLSPTDVFTINLRAVPKAPINAPRRQGLDFYNLRVSQYEQFEGEGTFYETRGGVDLQFKTRAPMPTTP